MSIDAYLTEARAEIDRVDPATARALAREGALLVDIRPHHDRVADGEIPGAVPIERIVLEWRLDPAGSHRLPEATADRTVIVFCNEGYASSLAARDLRRIGLPKAADLVGGFRAWAAHGLPVVDGGSPAVT